MLENTIYKTDQDSYRKWKIQLQDGVAFFNDSLHLWDQQTSDWKSPLDSWLLTQSNVLQ